VNLFERLVKVLTCFSALTDRNHAFGNEILLFKAGKKQVLVTYSIQNNGILTIFAVF
jgi:hypothetical protein